MNVSSSEEDALGGENVSRSGRVRKKSTLLAGFESLDEVEKQKKKPVGAKVTPNKNSGTPSPKPPVGGNLVKGKPKTTPVAQRQVKKSPNPTTKFPQIGKPPSSSGFDKYEMEMPVLAKQETVFSRPVGSPKVNQGGGSSMNKLKSQAQSTYMMEKVSDKKKPPSLTPGTPSSNPKPKSSKKDNKGQVTRVTGYTLWVKDQRAVFEKKYPNLEHTALSKKLSELWGQIPENQKKMWKNKAAKLMGKNSNLNIKNSAPLPRSASKKSRGRPRVGEEATNGPMSPPNKSSFGNDRLTASKSSAVKSGKQSLTNTNGFPATGKSKGSDSKSKQNSHSRKSDDLTSGSGTSSLDVAAHFALLGESLTVIGERLKNVEGQPVSGSLSVLLDSLLCATGPLLCLTQQVPEFNCIPPERLNHMIDNIAYVMPGL